MTTQISRPRTAPDGASSRHGMRLKPRLRVFRKSYAAVLPLAALPLFVVAILLNTSGLGVAGWLAVLAPAFFYVGSACLTVNRIAVRLEQRQARLEAEVFRRIEELDPQAAGISRQIFEAKLEQEVKRSKRHMLPLCVVTLTLPGLSRNRVVYTKDFMDLAVRALRAEDSIARLGRNQFAISLPHTTPSGAEVVIKRIAQALNEPSCEFGIAYLPAGRYATAERLIEIALATSAKLKKLAA
jgi:GGDEF domain-containing protein